MHINNPVDDFEFFVSTPEFTVTADIQQCKWIRASNDALGFVEPLLLAADRTFGDCEERYLARYAMAADDVFATKCMTRAEKAAWFEEQIALQYALVEHFSALGVEGKAAAAARAEKMLQKKFAAVFPLRNLKGEQIKEINHIETVSPCKT